MENVLTLEAFAKWVEKQPSGKYFTYHNGLRCACGQYAMHLGIRSWQTHTESEFWNQANDAAYIAHLRGETFGVLAQVLHKRLETA